MESENEDEEYLLPQKRLRKRTSSAALRSSLSTVQDEAFLSMENYSLSFKDISFPVGRILSSSNIQEMFEARALPRHLLDKKWETVFSTERDGTSFYTFMKNVVSLSPTIVVGQTTNGEILGGFADCPWVKQRPKCNDFEAYQNGFYGSGRSFLFEVVDRKRLPQKTVRDHQLSYDSSGHFSCQNSSLDNASMNAFDGPTVNTFPWTGANNFMQLCDPQLGRIAMGGGDGEFGFCFDDSFEIGSSGACDTFGNWRPLVSSTLNNQSIGSQDMSGSFFYLLNVDVYSVTIM
eukprot:CAMPEP_0113306880 /NCGR_PEP_ID=MMETSP0010_2-20120614/5956_1 /TAXON_ID=216773 ORGANISM="Corethron hystrix, Strain 308" /NCGR_SAMPLE_ID=MMETSP0010_2 /ASSEMBLY_ACC=CAM_ASM_000155 /LENGTH=289 /DNA_ID=CAMNT_0000161639 /DNA_START=650 /DNA_END=1519 /DNA_ORIENTATION=+ /assembly_acc=CAM_ASM_000155